ncbi:MAG: hypothetical protein HN366_22730, partial [Deltaproteobacteria bacterium]|nr:hypothetical protein [Deltaproteobacteria bacterium]
MKSWQGILINGCITVLAVFAAVGLFLPDAPPDKTKEIPEALNVQIKDIQLKLNTIEDAVLKQKEQAAITPAPSESSKNPEALLKLDRKLDMVLGKLAVLENQRSRTQAPQTFGRSFGPPMAPRGLPPALSATGQGPASWIDSLPDDKKREVEVIFEENAIRIREKLPPPDPNGRMPDRETVISVMKENDLLLKQELKTILTDEE